MGLEFTSSFKSTPVYVLKGSFVEMQALAEQ